MNILILGANGFIGNHLTAAILKNTPWHIDAMDLQDDKLQALHDHPNFHFKLGNMLLEKEWIEAHINQSDVVLPLVAIANPSLYVEDPLRVFELDFEANLAIVRACVRLNKRIIFPSTSEVYGMCPDAEFDEESSHLVTGPIAKERWIYSSSKQLLDRIIYAYGKREGLAYTLFRPFNWYGPKLDDIFNPKRGSSRVLSQFIGNILREEPIQLVNGGNQQRCFTYIDDGIAALLKIIENKNGCAEQGIFNIGNPYANASIKQLAEILIDKMKGYPRYTQAAQQARMINVDAVKYYGAGYQDVSLRVPSITRAIQSLGWRPTTDLASGIEKTLDYYLKGQAI